MLMLIQEQVKEKNMWEELSIILDSVDADFTGANGEQYYHESGISYFEVAVNRASLLTNVNEKIEYVLDACKEFSWDNYYNEFEYNVLYYGEGVWLITIATVR